MMIKELLKCTVAIALFLTTACADKEAKKEAAVNSQASFNIEGMTCAEGCAKSIEKTIGEMTGVGECTVNFKDQQAIVEFDTNKISQADIIAAIEHLNDGQYRANMNK